MFRHYVGTDLLGLVLAPLLGHRTRLAVHYWRSELGTRESHTLLSESSLTQTASDAPPSRALRLPHVARSKTLNLNRCGVRCGFDESIMPRIGNRCQAFSEKISRNFYFRRSEHVREFWGLGRTPKKRPGCCDQGDDQLAGRFTRRNVHARITRAHTHTCGRTHDNTRPIRSGISDNGNDRNVPPRSRGRPASA